MAEGNYEPILKSVNYSDTTNDGGGLNLYNLVNIPASRWVAVKPDGTNGDQVHVIINSTYLKVTNNWYETLRNTPASGTLYYI